jgi:type VI secretion system protein ImpM
MNSPWPPSSVQFAYFGKVASRGDFLRSEQHDALTRMLDQWLSQGLERAAADPRWKQRYDQVAPCRFAFLGARSTVGLAGHLIPSVDASGRRFPFVTAGSFDIESPLPFMAHAPLALVRLWSRLESIGREACAAADASGPLGRAAQARLEIDTHPRSYAAGLEDFLEMQTVGSLEALLRASHPRLVLRDTLLAIGLLLQPVPGSGMSRLDKGLALPLPEDPLYGPFVGALWMGLVAPFLAHGDFELAMFVLRRRPDEGACLCIGFAGGAPRTLQAVFDRESSDDAFVDVVGADWVGEHLEGDYAIAKLASYLAQPQLSMRQAMQTFKECFLGE